MKILHPLFTLMKAIKTTILFTLFTWPFSMFSQEKENKLVALITDRPDATESPNTIPKGYVQVETGSFFESFENNTIKNETYTYNTTLVRLGLLDNLEFRLGWDFVETSTKINGNKLNNVSSGFNPLLFGMKIAVTEEKDGFPEIGFLGHLYLPFTAGKDYKPENTGVDFRFSFSHTLSEKSSLSYNLGAQWADGSPEVAYVYSLSYGLSVSQKLGIYTELYGNLPENSKANHLWDAGFTYLLSSNVQLDATVGSSITEGQDILLSTGISFRLPTKKE